MPSSTPSAVDALELGSGRSRMRWRSAGLATAFTSSGVTNSRPASHAHALAACSSAVAPRGDTPSASDGESRGRRHSAHDVGEHRRLDPERVDLEPRRGQVGRVATGADAGAGDVVGVEAAVVAGEHLLLLLERRVADLQLEQEAVELGLGQRVGALVLDRVLGGDHDERVGQRVGLALDRDLPLLHRLEQRGLGLRRRAVDLVGEQQVGEHRALAERNVPPTRVEDHLADHVGRHQVGRELHALELEVERGGHRLDEQRLGHAGHAFEQHVAAHEQRGDEARQRALLADDDLADLVAQGEDRRRGRRLVSRRPWRTSWRMVSSSWQRRRAHARRGRARRRAPHATRSRSSPVRSATTARRWSARRCVGGKPEARRTSPRRVEPQRRRGPSVARLRCCRRPTARDELDPAMPPAAARGTGGRGGGAAPQRVEHEAPRRAGRRPGNTRRDQVGQRLVALARRRTASMIATALAARLRRKEAHSRACCCPALSSRSFDERVGAADRRSIPPVADDRGSSTTLVASPKHDALAVAGSRRSGRSAVAVSTTRARSMPSTSHSPVVMRPRTGSSPSARPAAMPGPATTSVPPARTHAVQSTAAGRRRACRGAAMRSCVGPSSATSWPTRRRRRSPSSSSTRPLVPSGASKSATERPGRRWTPHRAGEQRR